MQQNRDHDAGVPPTYRALLDQLREQFPQPVSDPAHDACLAFTLLRALDEVDRLKSHLPVLGRPQAPDFAQALGARVADEGLPLEACTAQLVKQLEGMFLWGHPLCQANVIPQPSLAGIVGALLASIYNPNLCSDEGGCGVSVAETRAVAMAADLVGYDPQQVAGVFTFGGTGALLYGIKVGLEKAAPGTMERGLRRQAAVLCSSSAHYGVLNAAGWLGIGHEQVLHVRSRDDNAVDIDQLRSQARQLLASERPLAAIVATLGTTDAFGLDDLEAIVRLRDELVAEFRLPYRPHVHADAVIGWAWSAFNDYDFVKNELGFGSRTVRALAAAHCRTRHLHLADSLGIDFHKTGYAPYVSSLVLFRQGADLQRVARRRETMPYLFQSGEHHPGMFTLETSRGGAGPMAALANLLMLGKTGLRTLLGHGVEMAEVLREEIEAHPDLAVLNGDNVGPVTLFRVYPRGLDALAVQERERRDLKFQSQLVEYNRLNRRVFERVHARALQGRGVVLSMTDCYRTSEHGTPIAALKSYVMSPFTDEDQMRSIVSAVLEARDAVVAEETR